MNYKKDDFNLSRGANQFIQDSKQQVGRNQDVEFSKDLADKDDVEALKRAQEAEDRVKKG